MQAEEERRLVGEIEALLAAAGDADAAEDARLGADERGDDLPSELRRREDRLAAIRSAKARLEAAQRAADDARGRQPGQDRNSKGGPPYKRAYGEPDEKAQSNFTDPESGIMKALWAAGAPPVSGAGRRDLGGAGAGDLSGLRRRGRSDRRGGAVSGRPSPGAPAGAPLRHRGRPLLAVSAAYPGPARR